MSKNKISLLFLLAILTLSLCLLISCDSTNETESSSAESTAVSESAESSEETTAEACEHTNFAWVIDTPATCTTAGTRHKECSDCGSSFETAEINVIAHTEEIVAGKNATCTEKGLTDGKKCSVCGFEILKQAEIPVASHTEVTVPRVAPTCTEKGLTEGKKCSVCNIELLAQTEIPATGHTEVTVDRVAPTCTEKGLTEGRKCSTCDIELTAQIEIPATGHTNVTLDKVAPTCTEDGLTSGTVCSVCDTTTVPQEIIPALDHAESDWIIITPAQIGVDGTKCKKCTRCDTELATETIPAIDESHVHEGIEWVVAELPTCKKEGVKSFNCACGQSMATESIPTVDHIEETVPAKAPTCKETGLTEGKKCSVCGDVLVAQETVPTAVHVEETIPAKSPTCKETGLTEGKKCSVCGDVLVAQESVSTVNHVEETIPAKAPTCKETGLTEGKKCSNCGDILLAQSPIAKADHTPKLVPGISASCSASGTTDGSVCAVCNVTLESQVLIPPTGHSFADGVCSGCGLNENMGVWIVDGLGNPVSDIIVKVMDGDKQIKMMPYKGEFLNLNITTNGTYKIVLDLSSLKEKYVYNEEDCVISGDKPTTTIRLFKTVNKSADETLFVGYPIELDYNAHQISTGSYKITLTPNDYTFLIFTPSQAATYTFTYECESTLSVGYHGGSFFTQGTDLSADSSDCTKLDNGISMNIYASNIGGSFVYSIMSTGATECIFNIKNVGDPGTRVEDEPWIAYLEDEKVVQAQLSATPEGEFTAIDLTDLTITAVYNSADGYYHLGSANGAVIYIDLTSATSYIPSVQTICANQRMGTYIYDANGKLAEKRSYNELFMQYGMPADATPPENPIRIPLTEKLAEAIKNFGNGNDWWKEGSSSNIFDLVHKTEPYNRDFAWLLFCGIYQ